MNKRFESDDMKVLSWVSNLIPLPFSKNKEFKGVNEFVKFWTKNERNKFSWKSRDAYYIRANKNIEKAKKDK